LENGSSEKFCFLEIGDIGHQNMENFMLISKMQTYLSNKMHPPPPKKKLKLKNNKWDFAKLKNGSLIFTFWGAFCHQDKSAFLIRHKIFNY
jgi:hypothetical protein